MNILQIRTQKRTAYEDITQEVQQRVTASGVTNGLALIASLHTTAGVTVNENADPDVMQDLLATLDRLVPRTGPYRHSEGNSDAHVKATLVGLSVTVPIENARLVLGTWQGIYLCDFDGPRQRRVAVQIVENR